MNPFRRILFIRLSAVGDVINTLPALGALRRGFPDAVIGYLVEDRTRDLIVNHPCVDKAHFFPRQRWDAMRRNPLKWPKMLREVSDFSATLRHERYDVALDFQGNLKGAFHSILSAAPVRVGFGKGHSKEHNHLFTHRQVVPPAPILNRVDKFLSMVASLGAPVEGARYELPPAPESRARVEAYLAGQGLKTFAAIHPGTSDYGKAKRWMPERFGAVAEHLGRRHRLGSLITWGPGEKALAQSVVDASKGHARLAMETGSLLDLAELVRPARLFVGCDSGPLHLSSAVGTPSVALFGPKDPRVYAPWNPASRVVKPGAPDALVAMADIPVAAVTAAADELLESRTAAVR